MKYLPKCVGTVVFLWVNLLLVAAPCWGGNSPAFWEVSKGDAKVFLMGSMHFGRADFYPMPAVIEKAYRESDKLVVEVDITKISSKDSMMILKFATLKPGESLKAKLTPSLYKKLEQYASGNNIPVSAFDTFQPWFISMQLVEKELAALELRPMQGVDLHFLKKGGKPVEQLETLESQMKIFGTLTFREQEQFLEKTLVDLGKSREYLTQMAKDYISGNVDSMNKTLLQPFREDKGNRTLFNKVFIERNHNMAGAVKSYLSNPQTVFFLVGAGHMIGKGGIVDILRRDGYKVVRVNTGALPSKAAANQ